MAAAVRSLEKRHARDFSAVAAATISRAQKLCPACNSLVGINATRCHECGANLRFSLAALSKGLNRLFRRTSARHHCHSNANVIMFAATLLIGFTKGQGQGFGILFSVNGEALYRLGMAILFATTISIGTACLPLRISTAADSHWLHMMVLLDIAR